MKKRLIAVLCILALTVGILTVVNAEEPEPALKVGYAKVDINPYWSVLPAGDRPDWASENELMPLFLTGTSARLASETLIDDNGDGVVDGNDGLQATCVAINKGDKTVLLISADLYNCYSELVDGVDDEGVDDGEDETTPSEPEDEEEEGNTDAVAAIDAETPEDPTGDTTEPVVTEPETNESTKYDKTGIRPKIIRTLAESGTTITSNMIMVSATHTNGSVNMRPSGVFGVYADDYTFTRTRTAAAGDVTKETYSKAQLQTYFNAYFDYLTTQIASAAQQAINDLEAATIQKGSIDVSVALGGTVMNEVHHYVQTGTDGISFVSDSNSNNKKEYTGERTPVSEADDMLHLITFQFENPEKLPIVMANWRSDASLNYNQNKNTATSDYVNALRYSLEYDAEGTQTMRSAFSLGASGNVSSVDIRTADQKDKTSDDYALAGVVYGQSLAQAAEALLSNTTETGMKEVAVGNIYTSQLSKYREPIQVPTDLELAAAQAHNESTVSSYPWKYTRTNQETGLEESYIIASDDHASNILRRQGYVNSWGKNVTRKMELNAILVGNELAFVTVPFEAADRYSMEATLNDTTDNDWNDLLTYTNKAGVTSDNPYGTPFVMSCTNDYIGHVPNYLAYNYNTNTETVNYTEAGYAAGCYESQISPVAAGSGETTVAKLDAMLESMSPVIPKKCEYCGEVVDWLPLTEVTLESQENKLPTGHYYLKDQVTYTASQVSTRSNAQVCLDLNGYTYAVAHPTNASRAFSLGSSSILNIWDTNISNRERGEDEIGTIKGSGVNQATSTALTGGTIRIPSSATVNLYGGILTQKTDENYGAKSGGVLYVTGTFNMYGGTVTGGKALPETDSEGNNLGGGNGGNIYIAQATGAKKAGEVNLYGGTITGGNAALYGGNIYISSGTLNVEGGTVTGGKADSGLDILISRNGALRTNENTAEETFLDTVYAVVSDTAREQVVLSGDGTIKKLGFNIIPKSQLVIDGTYNGKVLLNFNGNVRPIFGTDIGNVNAGADISGATITLNYKNATLPLLKATTHGSDLMVTGDNAAVINDIDGATLAQYDTLKDAVDAFVSTEGAAYIKVFINYPTLELAPVSEDYTLEKDTYLDLNGCTVGKQTGAITLSGEKTLYCMDSLTNDYKVTDGKYGKLTNVSGNVAAVPAGTASAKEALVDSDLVIRSGYLQVEEDDGSLSFHRLFMENSSVTLETGYDEEAGTYTLQNTGLYYNSTFLTDHVAAEKIKQYGVATSVNIKDTSPLADWESALLASMEQTEGPRTLLYSDYGDFVTGQEVKGTAMTNIMSAGFNPIQNMSRANIKVYGRPYVITTDDEVLFGTVVHDYSFRTLTKALNDYWAANELDVPEEIIGMYKNAGATAIMNSWNIPYIKEAASNTQ